MEVFKVRSLLTVEEIRSIHHAAQRLQQSQELKAYDNSLRQPDEMPFGLRPQHESLYLHADGYFARALPEVQRKVVAAIRGFDPREKSHTSTPLGVRCIEWHVYRLGGGLTDPQHCDMGSTLTLSCLLSEPGSVEGGVFCTWDEESRAFAQHDDLKQGDAVVFHSELVHNVTAVTGGTSGVRHSLVIEVWEGQDNTCDRHS